MKWISYETNPPTAQTAGESGFVLFMWDNKATATRKFDKAFFKRPKWWCKIEDPEEQDEVELVDEVVITVQIGNSDDKLTQKVWSDFYCVVEEMLSTYVNECHFAGTSVGSDPWQNACFVCSVEPHLVDDLKKELKILAAEFKQDSIAVSIGPVEMVG